MVSNNKISTDKPTDIGVARSKTREREKIFQIKDHVTRLIGIVYLLNRGPIILLVKCLFTIIAEQETSDLDDYVQYNR